MFQNHPLNLNFPSVIVIIRIVFVEIVEDADIHSNILKENNNNTEQQKNENVYEKIRKIKKKKREENINSLGDFLEKNKKGKGKKRMDNDESYFASLFLQHTTSLPILIPFSHLSELE